MKEKNPRCHVGGILDVTIQLQDRVYVDWCMNVYNCNTSVATCRPMDDINGVTLLRHSTLYLHAPSRLGICTQTRIAKCYLIWRHYKKTKEHMGYVR